MLIRLAARTYGIGLDSVREIIPFRRATRLPGTDVQVAGLVNVRGTIVTVIDLGARLDEGAGAAASREGGSMVLIEHGAKLVGVLVDEVLDVRKLTDVELGTDAAALVPGGAVRAVGRLDGQIVALLDIHDIISQVLT